MTAQRQGVWLHLYVCQGHLRRSETSCVRWKKKSERLLLEVTSSKEANNSKGHTDDTQVSPGTTFFLCLRVPSEWQVEHLLLLCYLLWNYNNNTWEHLTLAPTFFAKGHSSVNWKQSWNLTTTVSDLSFCNNSCSCPWPLHTETEWMMTEEALSDRCWDTQSKRWHLLTNKPGQEWLMMMKTVQWLP